MLELDHPTFLVSSRQGLQIIVSAIKLGLTLNNMRLDMFPVEYIYKHWKNSEGQVRLYTQIKAKNIIFNRPYEYEAAFVLCYTHFFIST